MQGTTTWILIADGAHARVLESRGPGKGLETVKGEWEGGRALSRELGRSKPGRTKDRAGQHKHAMEPPTDPHQHQEDEFLRSVAEKIKKASDHGSFDRLVVVAPPSALSTLRKTLAESVRSKVVDEVAKDLTNVPDTQIGDHLRDVVVF